MTIQVTGVQNPAGRKHPHVRVFGVRSADPRQRLVEFAAHIEEAVELIHYADANKHFPEVEVDDDRWCHCLGLGDMEVIHIMGPGAC